MVKDVGRERFLPVLARTRSIHRPVGPVAYDCVKLIFVRHGSAILLSEFGEKPVTVGDVVMLGASTLCGSEPEGSITVTTLYLDRDYVIDQVFWQHAALLTDRWQAQDFMDERYSEPAQILRSGENGSSQSRVGRGAARRSWGRRRGLHMMGVLTLPTWKTSTCLTVRVPRLI